jgi:hypothetical protein
MVEVCNVGKLVRLDSLYRYSSVDSKIVDWHASAMWELFTHIDFKVIEVYSAFSDKNTLSIF